MARRLSGTSSRDLLRGGVAADLAADLDATGLRFDTPEKHGYVPGVTADACASIIAAGNALSAAGGGVLLLGPITYTLGTAQGTAGVLIPAFPTNVTVMGWGDSTVLKVADGLNGVGSTFEVFSTNLPSITNTRVYGARFVGFKIDFNGANNPVPQTQTSKANNGIHLAHCERVLIQSVTFANNPGHQCVIIGANDSSSVVDGAGVASMIPGSFGIEILNCSFFEMASAVPGNIYSTDHSSLYINADQVVVANNIFRNTLVGNREMTAIEMHSTRGHVHHNTIVNFSHAINVAAQICDHFGMKYDHNVAYNCRMGFFFGTTSTFQLRDCDFEDNILHTDTGDQSFVELGGTSIMVGSVYATNLNFRRNRFLCTAGVTAFITPCFNLSTVAGITIEDNLIKGFSGRALQLSISPTAGLPAIDFHRNHIVDCCQTSNGSYRVAVALNSTNAIKRFKANGNRVTNSGAGRISIGGTYHAGDVITVTIGGVALWPYTVVAGDANLQGVAMSLAAWLNLEPTFGTLYVAEARNLDVVISTLTGGVSTTLAVAVTGAGNTVTAAVAASPFITYMTQAFAGNAPINDVELMDNDLEGVAGSFSFTGANVAPFIRHRGVGTPNNVIAAAQGSAWVDRDSADGDRYEKVGSLSLPAGWRLRRVAALPAKGVFSLADQIDLSVPVASAISGYRCTTAGGRKSGVWANGAVITPGQWVSASNGKVYSSPNGGTCATGSEPAHSSGSATGADGIVWTVRASTIALFSPLALGAAV